MQQQTFADIPFAPYHKSTSRARILNDGNHVAPWAELVSVIEPL